MQRVETLLQQLQDQFSKEAPPSKMLLTVQMLQHELLRLQPSATEEKEMVRVSLPPVLPVAVPAAEIPATTALPNVAETPVPEEKIIEVLQVDEAEIEAELEEMKRNAAVIQQISVKSKPQLLFETGEEDIPTLPQQPPKQAPAEINNQAIHDTPSLNDTLKSETAELSHKLADLPVKDLKKAIGINDRFLYINDLFRGDEAMYERSIKTINGFSIYPEAEYWIRRELKTKLGWKDTDAVVVQFDQLVKRRFS
jgi:hypothetical protein